MLSTIFAQIFNKSKTYGGSLAPPPPTPLIDTILLECRQPY